jgi:hypothetical protein
VRNETENYAILRRVLLNLKTIRRRRENKKKKIDGCTKTKMGSSIRKEGGPAARPHT